MRDVRRVGREPVVMRRARAVFWVIAVLIPGCALPVQAQAPASRLDRVIHGLSYRALPGTPAGVVEGVGEGVVLSPHDPSVRYRVDDRVHRSIDGGGTWNAASPVLGSGRLTVIAESPVEPGLLWAGSEDGSLHLTRDGGLSWTDVAFELLDPPAGGSADGGDWPSTGVAVGAPVREVVPSANRGGTAYVRLGVAEGMDPSPLLFRTDDYGEEWILLTGPGTGLPEDDPLTAFAEDPEGSDLLFVGTRAGVHVSFDDGGSWDLFRLDMPEAAIADLRIVRGHLLVQTQSYGRFVLDEIGPLRQVMRGLLTGEPYLFELPPVTVAGEGRSESVGAGRASDTPFAVPPIAFLDYLLPSFVRRVQIDVLDGQGRWLTTVRGEERPPGGQRPQGTRAGVHRVTWDLSYAGEDGLVQTVPPGSYTVRMTVDGLVRERILEVVGG
jgi:hypothetical protein